MLEKAMYERMIKEMREQYPNEQIGAIFGPAWELYETAEKLKNGTFDFNYLAYRVALVGEFAHFFGWHDGILNAMKTYCHMLLVDPALVEASLGLRFTIIADAIAYGTRVSRYIWELRCEQ